MTRILEAASVPEARARHSSLPPSRLGVSRRWFGLWRRPDSARLRADHPDRVSRRTPPIGCPTSPDAETIRSRPAFSVTSRSPPGSGSTAHGFSRPFASTTTSNATFERTAQARVWPANAGRWSDAFGLRSSSGLHGSVVAACAELMGAAARTMAARTTGSGRMTIVLVGRRFLEGGPRCRSRLAAGARHGGGPQGIRVLPPCLVRRERGKVRWAACVLTARDR
jgi:hypothetical protein